MTQQSPETTPAAKPDSQEMKISHMRYFKAPDIVATEVTEAELTAQLERERAKYLIRREKLVDVNNELTKLRKTLNALGQQEKGVDTEWRQEFVKGFGKQSKAVREKLKQKGQWASEASQIKEMITLLEPQAEWLKMQTLSARMSLRIAARRLDDLSSHNQLMNSLREMSESESMVKFSAAVPQLFERIEVDTYNDPLFMIGLGIDVSSQPGKSIATRLNNEDTRQINHEIRSRKHQALGELLVRFMPSLDDQHGMPVTQLPQLLECEAEARDYPSNIGFARRLKELELQMEYVPSLDDLDSAQA
ncbi:hypothetical protein AAG587_22050 [Vreelandella neptunia]|uniref:hypothetical protein n=1 Tax=Vreelandella neptunia TaxID=115551 RepID=UPI00315AE200